MQLVCIADTHSASVCVGCSFPWHHWICSWKVGTHAHMHMASHHVASHRIPSHPIPSHRITAQHMRITSYAQHTGDSIPCSSHAMSIGHLDDVDDVSAIYRLYEALSSSDYISSWATLHHDMSSCDDPIMHLMQCEEMIVKWMRQEQEMCEAGVMPDDTHEYRTYFVEHALPAAIRAFLSRT